MQIQLLLILSDPSHKRFPGSSLVKLRSDMGCLDVGLVHQSSVCTQDFLQRGVMSMEEAKGPSSACCNLLHLA